MLVIIPTMLDTSAKGLKINLGITPISSDGVIHFEPISYPDTAKVKGINVYLMNSDGSYSNYHFSGFLSGNTTSIKTNFHNYYNDESPTVGGGPDLTKPQKKAVTTIALQPYCVDEFGRCYMGEFTHVNIDPFADYYTKVPDLSSSAITDPIMKRQPNRLFYSGEPYVPDPDHDIGGDEDLGGSHGGGGFRPDFGGDGRPYDLLDATQSFCLSGVSVDPESYSFNVKWKNIEPPDIVRFIPDSDTVIMCKGVRRTPNSEREYYDLIRIGGDNPTFNDKYFSFSFMSAYREAKEKGYELVGEFYLTPYFYKDNICYRGASTLIKFDLDNPDYNNLSISTIVIDDNDNVVDESPIISGGDSNIDSGIDFSDLSKLTANFSSFVKELISGLGDFPSLLGVVFVFLPPTFLDFLKYSLVAIVFLRILGR